MKLIIDIPEVFYEALRKTDEIISGQRSGKTLMSVIYNAVANGIPLDDLRAEIDGIEINGQIDEHTLFARSAEEVKNMVLEIIDKYRTVKGANE